MKALFTYALMICSVVLFAQKDTVAGQVFNLKNLPKMVDSNRILTSILRGASTNSLENLRIHYSTLKPNHKLRPSHIQKNDEELIIVREGKLTVTINNKTKTIGAGSVLLIMPDDEQMMNNLDTSDVSYYVFIYHSKTPKNSVRADTSGGSLILDWNDIAFKPHDKGGRRDFFNRPTAMFKRFEMHVTNLNQGLKSHEPHTHFAEEIILMVKGDTKMQIGNSFYEGTAGDLFFLPSNTPHNLINTGEGQAVYFAFQFD
jgi:(S)-ureidoglycine aminohydrolase